MSKVLLAAALVQALVIAPAVAQQFACLDNPGRDAGPRSVPGPDVQSSYTWERLGQVVDPAAMQAITGLWHTETQDRATGLLQQIDYSFEPNGLFQYVDKTCGGGTQYCRPHQGNGMFRATRQQDGSIYFMINFSDENRTSQCVGVQVMLQSPTLMVSNTGARWQRVR